MVAGNDWAPPAFRRHLVRRRAAGARMLAMVEGCSFAKPGRYDLADEVLVWGPSGREAFAQPTREVGCPVIERMAERGRRFRMFGRRNAVINYKFTYRDSGADADFKWLAAAMAAARAMGLEPVVSAHPATTNLPENAALSDVAVEDLLRDAGALITRGSTVLYQALAIDVPTILFAAPGDDLFELAEPLGDFAVARNEDELLAEARALKFRRRRRTADGPFLRRHVSRDPAVASVDRIAAAVAAAALGDGAPARAG